MPAATKSYSGITPEKWKRITSAAELYGIRIDAHTGQGESYGITLSWSWEPARKRLTVSIVESTLMPDADALATSPASPADVFLVACLINQIVENA